MEGPACLAGARLGTYSTIKRALGGDEEHISLLRNLVAGCVSGGFAAAVTNPLDLVKTRLQSKDNPHKTIGQVVRAVVKIEGIVGLWAGTMPSVVSSPLAHPHLQSSAYQINDKEPAHEST